MDVSHSGVECEAYECVENGSHMKVIGLFGAPHEPKSGCDEGTVADLKNINVQASLMSTHDNIKSGLSVPSPTGS